MSETETPLEAAVEAPAPSSIANATPMLRQYLEIKARFPDALLFFRLGDFYELFFEDARTASELLGITLTSRAKGEDRIPMCGVPYHAAKGYIARLVEAGHRVAICDQVEEAVPGKTLVRRDVTRVVTPGTMLDEESREPKAATYLAACVLDADAGGAVAMLEASTGDFRVFIGQSDAAIVDELARLEPKELLVPTGDTSLDRLGPLPFRVTQTTREPREFEAKRGYEFLCKHFAVGALDGFGLVDAPRAWSAAAAVLKYVEDTQRSALVHVRSLVRYEPGGALVIDSASRKNLDLLKNSADGRRTGSLLGTIDKTATSMGGRLLAQWLLYPLTDVARIGERQDAVEELLASAVLREDLTGALKEIGDVERLVGRLVVRQGSPRDARLLATSLQKLPALTALLTKSKSPLLARVVTDMPDLSEMAAHLARAIIDEPPANTREGGVIRPGFHAELDELRDLATSGKDAIARMEQEEKKRTGIQSLKIRFNRVFGYYLEVTRANLASVPSDYVRKQTTAGAERYITPWLQEYEGKVLTAQDRSIALETRLFEEIRVGVAKDSGAMLDAAKLLATLDVLLSFARQASDGSYVRPRVDEGSLIRILDGRHPVVERALGREPFVPNDIELDDAHRLIVLTGPNMAGKSTAMRQVALVVILAQTGSFVPAREATIGVCDRVFTRVGAGDDLARGQSTFMIEMSETANILRHATARSLVLLDEIGRGTSTFDGLAIAWAVAEHVHDTVRCRTLFATHYHELTALARERPHVANLTMAVKEVQDRVLFLRKLLPGGASRSYGIQVAKLAGVPQSVVKRAKEVLSNLERASTDETGHSVLVQAGRKHRQAQLALGIGTPPMAPEAAAPSLLEEELAGLDVDAMTPMQALQWLHERKAAGSRSKG